jgi:sporulation protein YlmC with PRC-barrel domain
VLAKDGSQIGRIFQIRTDPKDLSVQGIIANKGIFADDYYIGKDYIDRLNDEGAVLNIVPVQEFVGKKIFDYDGKKIGTVKRVKRKDKTNDMFALVADRGINKEDLIISENVIREIGENVLLKKTAS